MYTFRFNPLCEQWVILGGPVFAAQQITEAHLLDTDKKNDFVAAAFPKSPFIMDPPTAKHLVPDPLVHASQPPVGEYELLLYRGDKQFYARGVKEWEKWLLLLQQRLSGFQHNPHLHFINVSLHTQALESVEQYQRVGDVIATSHPVSGVPRVLDVELAEKIHKKESLFALIDDIRGRLYVPSAPLYDKEVWFIPAKYRSSIAHIDASERTHLAAILAALFSSLKKEHPHEEYVLTIHTNLIKPAKEVTWWLQLYRAEPGVASPLPVRRLPEAFVQQLRYLLG